MKKLFVINWVNPRTRENGTVSEKGAYKTFQSKEAAEATIEADEILPVKGDRFQMIYFVEEIWMRTKVGTENAEPQKVDTAIVDTEKTAEKAAESLDNAKVLVEKTVEVAVKKATEEKQAQIDALKAKLAEKENAVAEDAGTTDENADWGGTAEKGAKTKK